MTVEASQGRAGELIGDRPLSVREFWDQRVAASADREFVVGGGESWTYQEFDAWTNRLANGLAAAGVGAGTVVALLLPSSVELLRLELAIQKLGAVMLPLIAGSTLSEIRHVLGDSGAGFLITDEIGWGTIAADEDAVAGLGSVFVQGREGELSYESLETSSEQSPPPPGIGALDPAALMYTSGSTSKPKGVVQPQGGFATAGFAIAERMGAGVDDTWLCPGPLFHTGSTHMVVAPAIAAGSRLSLMPRFSPSGFWESARASGATLSAAAPAMLSLLETLPPSPADREHSIRALFCHVRPRSFVERFGIDVCTVWAMTETSGLGTLTEPRYDDYEPQLIGWPFPADAEVKVIGEDGEELPAGSAGELCFRHPFNMLRYHEDADNTEKTLVDGWVRTGDLCRLDAQGRAYFHGRLKNVIKRAGENIAGEEVEFTVVEHPGVEACIVVGVPDPIRTEEVHATVSVRAESAPTPEQVAEWVGERLSPWKVPRYVQIVREELPRLENGKVDRAAVTAAVDLAASWDGGERRSRRDTDG